jgi:hypothetical protein
LIRPLNSRQHEATAEKNRLLTRVVDENPMTVRNELLRRFRDERGTDLSEPPRRMVAALDRRLDELARNEDAAWSPVDAYIAIRKPVAYDAAAALLADLKSLAERDGHKDTFNSRVTTLRQTHARKPRLIEGLNHAGI